MSQNTKTFLSTIRKCYLGTLHASMEHVLTVEIVDHLVTQPIMTLIRFYVQCNFRKERKEIKNMLDGKKV